MFFIENSDFLAKSLTRLKKSLKLTDVKTFPGIADIGKIIHDLQMKKNLTGNIKDVHQRCASIYFLHIYNVLLTATCCTDDCQSFIQFSKHRFKTVIPYFGFL